MCKAGQGECANLTVDSQAPYTLRIGVAGSRRIPPERLPAIRESLRNLYSSIKVVFDKLSKVKVGEHLDSRDYEHNRVRLVSSLAEGIDRLAVDESLIPFEHELAAVIPFSVENYRMDFSPENSVVDQKEGTCKQFDKLLERLSLKNNQLCLIELDGNLDERETAYRYCSQVHMEHCDILIAIYDLSASSNVGTGATVTAAKLAGLPIIEADINAPEVLKIISSSKFGHQSRKLIFSEDSLEKELSLVLLPS